jgi:3-dehydroquinate synthase
MSSRVESAFIDHRSEWRDLKSEPLVLPSVSIPTAVRVSANLKTSYPIVVGPVDRLTECVAREDLPRRHAVVVSDENVWSIYGERIWKLGRDTWGRVTSVVLEPGEGMKSIEKLSHLHDRAFDEGIDRDTTVVAFGGGVIGDLAGFAAATLLRGLPLVHVPTSLIAQVDSSIGGKTGINHPAGKNLIGSFYAPRLVVTDPGFLQTLPDREFGSGLAEVVKHALIADEALAVWMLDNWTSILERDSDVLHIMLERAIRVKIDVVEKDVLEHGQRAFLNFGHTFGHAIEKVAGYGAFTHGEAVSVGMRAAVHLSARRAPEADFEIARALVSRLPVLPDPATLDTDALIDAMKVDKKARAGTVRFVVLDVVGRARVIDDVEVDALRAAIDYAKTA